MNKYFSSRSEMTQYAEQTGLEIIRCKLSCSKLNNRRSAILVIENNIVKERLIYCKLCSRKEAEHESR